MDNISKPKKEYKKKPSLNTRTGKYFLAVQKGLSKTKAQLQAGYADGNHMTEIENSKTYKAIEKKYYKDALLDKITLQEIADEQIKVIKQDTDKGAKNKAIEQALSRIEPEITNNVENDRVLVILR